MSDEELIAKAQSGDEQAEEHILNKYKPMVNSVARSFFLVGAELDDLIQEGMIGLYRACQKFSADNASFKTFAYICVRRQIQSAIKSANRQKNKMLNNYVSLDNQGGFKLNENTSGEDAILILPSNTLSPDNQIIEKENLLEMVESIKKALSSLELRVLTLYLKGNSYQAIANMLGKNSKSVDNCLHRIKNKLSYLNN